MVSGGGLTRTALDSRSGGLLLAYTDTTLSLSVSPSPGGCDTKILQGWSEKSE